MSYAYGSYYAVFYFGYLLSDFTYILQGYFTGTGASEDAPVPVK